MTGYKLLKNEMVCNEDANGMLSGILLQLEMTNIKRATLDLSVLPSEHDM